jgi:hypothetical protein
MEATVEARKLTTGKPAGTGETFANAYTGLFNSATEIYGY